MIYGQARRNNPVRPGAGLSAGTEKPAVRGCCGTPCVQGVGTNQVRERNCEAVRFFCEQDQENLGHQIANNYEKNIPYSGCITVVVDGGFVWSKRISCRQRHGNGLARGVVAALQDHQDIRLQHECGKPVHSRLSIGNSPGQYDCSAVHHPSAIPAALPVRLWGVWS